MGMTFEDLNELTRHAMLREFEAEQSSSAPYLSKGLSPLGLSEFPHLMRDAILNGNELTLADALSQDRFWLPTETYVLRGVTRERRVNIRQAAERLAITEFNTWYVRGLTSHFIQEGVRNCRVYRAAQPKWEPAECASHENAVYPVTVVYNGHRARYWPEPGDASAISVPFGPGCHHTIGRLA